MADLEHLQLHLRAIQRARASYAQRFNELYIHPAETGGVSEPDRLSELEDLRRRLQSLAEEEERYTGLVAKAEDLERDYEDMSEFDKALRERIATIKNEREKQVVNLLLKRAFSDACEWDRRHKGQLATLALRPKESTWIFRLQNWFHLRVHRH